MKLLTKQVQDLPRQYRRTNREWPSAPSVFVSRIVKQLSDIGRFIQVNILHKLHIKVSPTVRSQAVELFEEMVLQTTDL